MAYELFSLFPPQFEGADGLPLVLGSISFYVWNTTTETPFYTDSIGTEGGTSCALGLIGQPINGAGTSIQIFLDTAITYKVIRKDATGTPIAPTLGPYRSVTGSLLEDLANDTDPALGSALVGHKGGTVADRLTGNLMDFYSAVEVDDTGMFQRAMASGHEIICNASDGPFTVSGTMPIASNTLLIFHGGPVINMTVDGDERGFHFDHGTTDAEIRGAATINITTDTAGADGSYNSAFGFGRFYYTTDPLAIRRCKIGGPIVINCIGSANSKPVHIYGWCEDVLIEDVQATGQTNYTFSAHWSGNGSSGVLPTKTWHPHNVTFRRCKSFDTPASGDTLRSYTASACGKVVYEDCDSIDVDTLNFNLFVGDYGYTYAQNITNREAFRVFIIRCKARGLGTGLSFDAQTTGLNGSPIWTGSSHYAALFIDGLDILIDSAATATVGFAVSHPKTLQTTGLRIIEQGTSNAERALTLFGVGHAYMRGELVSRFGSLIRACGTVDMDMPISTPLPEPDSARYGISASASSGAATTSGAVSLGGTSVTLVGNTLVTGAGGYLRYDDGVTVHEIDILTSTYSSGNQTVTLSPTPVAIPDASSVTVIQTVKRLVIGLSRISGYASALRTTGSATAKVRNVSCRAEYHRCGVYDADLVAVDGFDCAGARHTEGGQRTTTTNRYGYEIGVDASNFSVAGVRFDGKNTRLRYLVRVDNAAANGSIYGNHFESYNSGATNPAAVFLDAATNVYLDTNTNILGAGVPLAYP